MTRCAIDADTALELIDRGITDPAPHHLVAPSLLRSHVTEKLLARHRAGEITAQQARERLEDLARLRIRLLGDRVSRRLAFDLAVEHGLTTAVTEYLSVARLQADVLITTDRDLVTAAGDQVTIARIDVLLS